MHAGLSVAQSFIYYIIIVIRILSNKKQNLSIAGGQCQQESDSLNPQVLPNLPTLHHSVVCSWEGLCGQREQQAFLLVL